MYELCGLALGPGDVLCPDGGLGGVLCPGGGPGGRCGYCVVGLSWWLWMMRGE